MTAQNLNLFQHPRFNEIQNYTAIRLKCDIDDLKKSGSTIVEWSSWNENLASIALAKSLGFKQFLSKYELLVS